MDRNRRATLSDVARVANVHASTASRILSGRQEPGRIPETTIKRVLAVAAELNYRPNRLAVGLRSQRSQLIGVMATDINQPAFPAILLAIEQRLAAHGFLPILVHADAAAGRAEGVLNRLIDQQLEGLILASSADTSGVSDICRAQNLPLVLLFNEDQQPGVASVSLDERHGIEALVAHLTGLGHRKIVHLGGPGQLLSGQVRAREFVSALAAHGLAGDDKAVWHAASYSRTAGRAACAAILEDAPQATAILCAHDNLALGCYDVLAARGLRCPEDISITGHSDIPNVDLVSPPLTTMGLDSEGLGAAAADLVLGLIEGSGKPASQQRLKASLIVRASTAPPR